MKPTAVDRNGNNDQIRNMERSEEGSNIVVMITDMALLSYSVSHCYEKRLMAVLVTCAVCHSAGSVLIYSEK